MSREIRRVPVGWKHPLEPNPYWQEQDALRRRRGDPLPRLHAEDVRFVALLAGNLAEAQREWDEGYAAWGGPDNDGSTDGDDTYEDNAGPRPLPSWYMPDFGVPEEQLGWCLYQTVSEGTPTTPVFATPEELVEHLVQVGEDYDQKPYRREAAEQLVRRGSSIGSFVSIDGRVLDSARDADRVEELTRDR